VCRIVALEGSSAGALDILDFSSSGSEKRRYMMAEVVENFEFEMDTIELFSQSLGDRLKPMSISLAQWSDGGRRSKHLLELDTGQRKTVLYVKVSNSDRGFWGLRKSHVERLGQSGVRWFAVFLHASPQSGYLLPDGEVEQRIENGTFELSGDGDYKINHADLQNTQSFGNVDALVARVCNLPRLVFPEGFTDRDEWEMERKGFVYAFLECEDGSRYPVMFIDPVRLAQDVEATLQSGQPYYYEFGQVVVPEVTVSALTGVIPQLVEEGFLERHKPVRESAATKHCT
jgi:hypothetical protein